MAAKPVIVIDHHETEGTISFANVVCNHPVVATGELLYEIAKQLHWPLNHTAMELLASSILSDSLGLTTDATTARSIHIIGEIVESGVSIAELDQKRRELMRKSPELIKYKGELLQRIEYYADNRLAIITIPWHEIERYSPQYNPSMLVIDEMRGSIGTSVAVAFKLYNDGHITAKIRANYGFPIAAKLAEHFGGGGHAYASGFKTTSGQTLDDLKKEVIAQANLLLDELARQ